MVKEYAIGETFQYNGMTLKTVKFDFSCVECYFRNKDGCLLYECRSEHRADSTDVCFREVEEEVCL